MSTVEASRQYQLAVEHERHARRAFDGVVSAEAELADATEERRLARERLIDTLVERETGALA